MRARLGAACSAALVSACVLAGSAAAAVTAVSDQRAAFFDSPAYRALDLNHVRLVVPWDAGLRAGPWDAWIARAQRDGATITIGLEHVEGEQNSSCPDAPCPLPARAAYGAALAALLARYPFIREVTPWNEPNHSSQPTFRRPDAAAGYYDEARARCPDCTLVAGDLLDDGALPGYLSAYKAALTSTPSVWGLHDYYDTTYFRARGVQTMLDATSGRLWLTETGGIVSFEPPGGGGLPYDEQRAADGVTWLYELAGRFSRIERVYLYQWQGTPDNSFDSGLLGYDGTPRPAYDVVARQVGPRGGASASAGVRPAVPAAGADAATARLAAPGSRATLRIGRRLRLYAGGRLQLRARCIARGGAGGRCRQRLVVRVGGRVAARVAVDVAASRLFVRVVRLPAWARSRLVHRRPRRVELQSCARSGRPCAARTSVAVTKPLVQPVRR